jgi:protein SCO1/2
LGAPHDFELTNQDGARVRLSDLRGKVVLMNFIYTSCPSACQLQNFDLMMVRNGLDEASRKGLVLLSISFDPEVDTPQVLKEYAAARSFDVPEWEFLTGTIDEIARVTEAYGVEYKLAPAEEHVHPDGEVHPHQRAFNHLNQAFLIDPQGMGRKSYLGIQIGQQVFAIEEMLADVKSLLPR